LALAGDTARAMAQEHFEIVRQGFEAFNAFMRGELSSEAYAEHFDPQIDVHWHERTYPDTPQHFRGAKELIVFAEQYRGGWADLVAEPLELIEAPGGRSRWWII
jgi:hypothetical protein